MDGRLVTDSSGERGSSTGDPNEPMPLRARILHLIEESNSENGNTGQNVKEIFLEQIWPKLESDYQRMSTELAEACKAELGNRIVPIPVTVEDRVKSRTSISKSLQRREIHRTKEDLGMYKSLDDILEDLHDLVGIRIIVEYLDHLEDVSHFVTGSFNQEKEPNRFDANRKVGHLWQPWFGAYECMNYHISSKYEDDDRLSVYNGVKFEIQVTSLPAHMYNKIAHPLLYKEEAGTLSQGDEMVIDITKGLAYCYSLCLHFKRSKQRGDVGKQDTELLKNISSPSGELDESSLNCLAGRIPKLDFAARKTMDIPRESLRLALDSLLNDQIPDDIGQALADRFSREIKDIAQPPINLVTSGNARFDSQDVHSSPVCQEGTQTCAIQYIHDWINEGEKALLWIYSHAGTGKSTLARTIARELTETSQIAAGYFFKRGDSNRNDVSRVFPTIASQLMSTIPRYEPFLRKSVIASKNPDIETMRLDEQFKVLIGGPLSEIGIISSTKVIIIDALDECTNLIEASKIIKLLCSLRDLNPLRFRFLVTSRDENLVRKAINTQTHQSLQLATTFRNNNISDIRSILRLGFEDIRKEIEIKHAWPTDGQFEVILQRSINPSPLFIYVATFLRFLNEGKEMCTSEKRLQWWIDQTPSTAGMSQLEGLYTTVFENLDRNKKDGTFGLLAEEEKKDLRTVLSTVVLAVEPLSTKAISSISRVDLGITRALLKCCRAVLEISDDDRQPVKAVHKSFSDFILRKDPLKRLWFHADEMESHDHIAEGCTYPKASSMHLRIGGITCKEETSKTTHMNLWYGYWKVIFSIGLSGHPFESMRRFIPFLKDARRFILRHGDTIRENPLQTYGAALLFSPVESLIRPILPDNMTVLTKSNLLFKSWDFEALNSVVKDLKQPDLRRLDGDHPIRRIAISPSGRFMITLGEDEQSLNVWRLPEATFERCLTVDHSSHHDSWSFTQLGDVSKNKEAFMLRQKEVTYIWFLEGTEDTHNKQSSAVKLPIGDLCLSSISEHREEVSKFGLWSLLHRTQGVKPQHVNSSMTDGRMAAVSFKDTAEVYELGLTASLCFDFKEPGNQTISAIALSPSSTYFAISYGTTIMIWTLADPSTKYEVRTNKKAKSLVFSPDESLLMSSSNP
ncbi:hypothetical protein FPRO03_12974 [Fusarium proliferatum]|nr:hypothetical protein FPRO03_12974 [Fusarium proliferatum]